MRELSVDRDDEPAAAPVEPARASPRATMNESRAALKKEVRQVQRRSREAPAPVDPVPAAAPAASHGNGKMVVFMILGILAGAAAAVAAVKFLLKI
jgi:hypothetical protein